MLDAIPHQIRFSRRARYVSLRIYPGGMLEVIVPPAYDVRKIPALLESKRVWIATTKRRLEAVPPPEPVRLPTEINLSSINETWRVEYRASATRSVRLIESDGNVILLSGRVESQIACRRALRRWLLRKGQELLIPWLCDVSRAVNLPFSSAAVRLQRSRWGSCSRRGTVSLNAKLLFLRPELIRYLFIHELCHTIHMNHSERYWKFVRSKEPNMDALDREMRTAMRQVPRWAQ